MTATHVQDAIKTLQAGGAVEIASLLWQSAGGKTYIIYPRTVAENVDMGDGSNVLDRIAVLERALAGNTTTTIVENIAERDLIASKIPGDRCIVLDATADPTVQQGGAEYIWMPAKGAEAPYWRKLTEEESQDVILQWESIIGKPEQPVAKIDEAALLAHAHDNKSLLDSLDKDENGRLTIGGKPVDDGKRDTVTTSSLGEELPAKLRDGGLLILIQK